MNAFAEAQERTRRELARLDLLATKDEVALDVVITPIGGGGTNLGPTWVVTGEANPWILDGVQHDTPLHLRMPAATREALLEGMRALGGNLAVRVLAKLGEEDGATYARVTSVEGPSSVEALNEVVARRAQPVTHEMPDLGVTFTLDRRLDWWRCETTPWRGRNVSFALVHRGETLPEPLIELARDLLRRDKFWDTTVKSFAADRLLGLKNSDWLRAKQKRLTERGFKTKVKITTIVVRSDAIEFYAEDNELFWGHTIIVYANLEGPTRADIAG